MKIYIVIILIFFSQLGFAQLAREELSLKVWPKSYQLDIQEQKKCDDVWKNETQTKYTVNLFNNFYIDSQIQYDSLKNNITHEHRYKSFYKIILSKNITIKMTLLRKHLIIAS